MTTFLTTAFVAFIIFIVSVLIINYCKTRANKSKHELTGMCHRSGGVSCCSGIKNVCTKD